MTIQDIATKLTAYCSAGKFNEAYNTLFAQHAKSIEPDGTIADGLTAILKKSDFFVATVQFVACEVGEAQIAGNYFSMAQTFHSVIRQTGEKKQMQEIAVYKVENGQIVEERFFY